MTKRKIVINVTMASAKSRSRAMVLAAKTNGVSSIRIAGDDLLEVVGEGIDITCLAKRLRKKLGHAEIQKVEEVKDKKPDEKKNPDETKLCACPAPCSCAGYHHALLMTPLVCFDEPAVSSSCHVM